ncbi:MAG TPA: sulfurtransferase [Intrasporangiaceae bacterium]|nr:sulfurtransferase [Intrasporangiaceae bacterium]
MADSALIRATDLAERLEEVVVLDVQFTLDGQGSDLYAAAHLPGAAHLDLDTVLADPAGPRGRHPLPSAARLEAGLRALGVDDDSSVVVYDQATSLGAARAWWVLRWAGLRDVRVLDGGLAAWQRAGLPVETATTSQSRSYGGDRVGTVTVRPGSVPHLEADEILDFIAGGGTLLDARAPERFRGEVEPIDPVAGHIPGAVNLPTTQIQAPDGTFAAPEAIRAVLGEHGIPLEGPVGTSCGSGVTAAQLTLALHEAGIESRPYIGSWSEWITDPQRPRAAGPA